jgi:hypothetical protein
MGSWTFRIHIRTTSLSVFIGFVHYNIYLLFFINVIFGYVFNIHPFFHMFSYFQITFLQIKKILYLFHVYLHNTDLYGELYWFLHVFYFIKNRLYHSRDDSFNSLIVYIFSLHSICFTGRSLSVCEYGTIITLKYTFYNLFTCIKINVFLLAIWWKNSIKGVSFWFEWSFIFILIQR